MINIKNLIQDEALVPPRPPHNAMGRRPNEEPPPRPPPPDELFDGFNIRDEPPPRPAPLGGGPANIQPNELILGEQLGEGEFGEVKVANYRGKDVAVKTLKSEAADQSHAFLQEATLMAGKDHPNVVKMIGISRGLQLMIVVELLPHGALNKYLKANKDNVRPESLSIFILQVAKGMAYLATQKVVHRDLAARNILVKSEKVVKISDFGLSKTLAGDYYRSARAGKWPIKWYAPECIYFSKFDHQSDVWSFGIASWEIMMYGKKPYKGLNGRNVVDLVHDKGGRLPPPPQNVCPPAFFDLMLKCWSKEANDRPTFSGLVTQIEDIIGSGRRVPDRRESEQHAIVAQAFYDYLPDRVELENDNKEERLERSRSRGVGLSRARALRPFERPFADLQMDIQNPLDDGSLGEVLTGYLKNWPTKPSPEIKVCIKTISVDTDPNENDLMDIMRNDINSIQGRARYLVKFMGLCMHPDGYWMMLTEYVPCGPLNEYLRGQRRSESARTPYGTNCLIKFAYQVVMGMRHLESKRIVHRDLACRNVLVHSESPPLCKISDFGRARALRLDSDHIYYSGSAQHIPIKWYAPECLMEQKFSSQSDLWSFGITFWEIMSMGAVPYSGMNRTQVLHFIKRERLSIPLRCQAEVRIAWTYDIMMKCWKQEPSSRGTFEQLEADFVRHTSKR